MEALPDWDMKNVFSDLWINSHLSQLYPTAFCACKKLRMTGKNSSLYPLKTAFYCQLQTAEWPGYPENLKQGDTRFGACVRVTISIFAPLAACQQVG
jgi:hypothetical protein